VYPNPVAEGGNITIERFLNNSSKGIQIEVLDMTGRRILFKTLKSNENKLYIPGAAGNYLLKMTWDGNNYRNFKIYKK
jgi:hypothetical protein